MQQTKTNKLLSFILCIVLIAAIALIASGCNANENNTADTGTLEQSNVTTLGTGQTVFNFTVVDKDGNETHFEIHTDKTTVGEALLALNLIEGEVGAYGLYVKKVNGILADYNLDGTYWAFYENGEYAVSGVDTTNIVAGTTYSFKVSK